MKRTMNGAKAYNRTKIILQIINLILSFTFLCILVFTPIAVLIETFVYSFTTNEYIAFMLFLIFIGLISSLISFPIDFYSSYILEHKYLLSNQKLVDWFFEKSKGSLVSLIIIIPLALVFYYLLRNYELWWLIFAVVIFMFSILLVRLAPTLIFPIFYKFKPIENEDLKHKLTELCNKYKIDFEGIFTFNLSKNTKKANAGFTGIFKSKRIILSDTLMENFTDREILTVFAHELGHYKMKHISKNIIIGFVTILLTFYLTDNIYQKLLNHWEFYSHYKLSALPLLFLIFSILSLLLMPLSNYISRIFEYQADDFAIKSTQDKESFVSALKKLSKINLADENPNPIIEFIFYSHPSIKKRIDKIKSINL